MDSEWFANIFRALVRPAVTIMFAAGIVDMVVSGRTPPTWFLSMAGACITWWFADRTVGHVAERKNNELS